MSLSSAALGPLAGMILLGGMNRHANWKVCLESSINHQSVNQLDNHSINQFIFIVYEITKKCINQMMVMLNWIQMQSPKWPMIPLCRTISIAAYAACPA